MNSRYKKLSITLALIFVVGIAGSVVFWKVLRARVDTIYANELSRKKETQVIEQEKNLQVLLENVSPEIAKIRSRVIPANGTVSFITNLESLARGIGTSLTISSVEEKPAEKEGPENFEYLDLTITASGSWNQVYKLLEMIETLPYKTNISGVSLSQSLTAAEKDKSQQSRWDERVTLQVLKNK